jgi:hypothetical protein
MAVVLAFAVGLVVGGVLGLTLMAALATSVRALEADRSRRVPGSSDRDVNLLDGTDP